MKNIEKYFAVKIARQIAICPHLTIKEKAEALDELKYEVSISKNRARDADLGMSNNDITLSEFFVWRLTRKGTCYWRRIHHSLN